MGEVWATGVGIEETGTGEGVECRDTEPRDRPHSQSLPVPPSNPSLQELDLSDNHVTEVGVAPPLPRLWLLRLDRNPIGHAPALAPLAAWPRLTHLGLAETPLGSAPSGPALLAELLPGVDVTFT
ncbi:geranylgeranyl transferase type-2 subunit alpha-like [Passer montanus]|uniref:geranylgeranyl transferase type-2 subunit alpha-like n=1 Tax=Passer montanus TaxID=9160 RepID=UPI00195FC4FD|nr:geranylgeranyl transferase type-2 subunit alpha-like [Passer montanus]